MKQLDQASSKQRQKDFYLMKQIMWDDDFMTSENMRTVKQHYKSPKGQKHADKLKRPNGLREKHVGMKTNNSELELLFISRGI